MERKPMKILVCDSFDSSLPEKLKRFGEVFDDQERLAEADVALVRSRTKCTSEWLSKAKNLKLIIRGGVGLDNVDLEAAKSMGIDVRNTPEASSIAVAELAATLLLCLANPVIQGHKGMERGEWLKKELKRTELFGKTLGLLGVGRIGTEVARRMKSFGMKILGYDPYVKEHDMVEMVDIGTLLKQSDFISLHMPLTDETRGMVNITMIERMKDGVGIVNTGRAACIVEKDLAEALEDGKVGGYATDVWMSDPPDWNSPILKAPNVIMLPHIGASTKENLLRIGERIIQILEEYENRF